VGADAKAAVAARAAFGDEEFREARCAMLDLNW
jgi:hypothetical protein